MLFYKDEVEIRSSPHAQSVPRDGLWERRKLELAAKRPSARPPERLAPLSGSAAPQHRGYE